MNGLKSLINRHISGKKVLFLFLLSNLVYGFMLIITIPKTMSFSGGMKLLDMMPTGYDSEYISKLLKALGEKGREAYLYDQIPVDMVYPFLFAISSCLMIAYFLKKLNRLDSPFFYLCLIPLIAGIADYFENIGIITMLNNYPVLSPILTSFTNSFTILKSVATTLYFVILIIVLIILGLKTIKGQKQDTTSGYQ